MDYGGLPGDLRDLLPGIVTVHRHGHCIAGSGFVSVIFAAVPAAVRSRVGCVGENSGSSGDACAAGPDRHAGSAASGSRDKSATVHNIAGIAESIGALAL
jgi:hypothetical protein